ncbi:calcium uniporter regulatory subunit MCUb, mitochondrial isoform X2 [Pelobates cultripes]|uniref:Calcium uniporter protein n=1 Tax=Pelobates cultripes TaxID=61616 RepID=A0AAD1QYG9_PELCU|nr:calcium uniporter regulatory subunit MCUb, mitochondrial isoform X2 [Pelobates cultripes]
MSRARLQLASLWLLLMVTLRARLADSAMDDSDRELEQKALIKVNPLRAEKGGQENLTLEGIFARVADVSPAEGRLLQFHPLSLCNTSEDDQAKPGFISIVKLETPDRDPQPCLSLANKARLADVTVHYSHGLPVITLPLPSRKERCQFTVKPMTTSVGTFLKDIQKEDRGINMVSVTSADGIKFSSTTLMDVLLMNDFRLVINDSTYLVQPPPRDMRSFHSCYYIEILHTKDSSEMDAIKSLVHRLHTALHSEEHYLKKEQQLMRKLDDLNEQLRPLEQVRKMKAEIMAKSDGKTTRLMWIGLALMSTQGGALAWLTWWVYSWDIMEPVTYFIGYGSAIAFYAYFVLTKEVRYFKCI